MKVLKLVFKNILRHKLRSVLTISGIAIAVIAFGILRTVVTSFNVGVEATASNRLITRQAVSFIFPLDYSYRDKISKVQGVKNLTFANWFSGVYKDKNNFFARMAVDHETFFDVYPEFILDENELKALKEKRNACILGKDIAKEYNFKIGDIIPLEGDIYPGRWEFEVVGIYDPRDEITDASQMLFRWDFLHERIQQDYPERTGEVGWYIVDISNPSDAAKVSAAIDARFKDSPAPTKTETERAFASGFIQSVGAILTAMDVLSFIIIGVIMMVLANTMIMSARERTREYAVLKTLGFSTFHITGLIFGESMLIAILGAGAGLFFAFPIIEGFSQNIPKGIFPVFQLDPTTVYFAAGSALLIGVVSAIFPVHKALSTKIVDGFRFVG